MIRDASDPFYRVLEGSRKSMRELLTAIPDVEVLLSLEPEELGAKLLFLARGRREHMFSAEGTASELWSVVPGTPEYPPQRRSEILLALREAWAWLEAQGLHRSRGGPKWPERV